MEGARSIDRFHLSLIISTIRPACCAALLESLQSYARAEEIIVIVDGESCGDLTPLRACSAGHPNIRLVINRRNEGLSASRNLGLELATHACVVFLDDDTRVISDIVAGYRALFRQGFTVAGGPLLLPASYPPIPAWLPPGFSSLLGVHTTEKKIWGGNFGVVRAPGMRPTFREELGRKGGGLQSGDDTTFISELMRTGRARQVFACELAVEHHIDLARYRAKYLAKRAFWQGRSEIRRRSAIIGTRKELRRAFSSSGDEPRRKARLLAGVALLICFFAGLLWEASIIMGRRSHSNARARAAAPAFDRRTKPDPNAGAITTTLEVSNRE